MEPNTLLFEVWKKTRDTVEHFDKILSDFRKIAFALNAAVIPIAFQICINSNEWPFYLMVLGVTWNLANFLIWMAEKHYHVYLVVTASLAKGIEKELGLKPEFQLTSKLASAKKKQTKLPFFKPSIHFYDFIYIVFGFLGLSFSMYYFWAQHTWVVITLATVEIIIFVISLFSSHDIEHK